VSSHDDPRTGGTPSERHEAEEPRHEAPGAELTLEEEPVTTGTLFIMMVFLMALAGMWFLVYLILIGR